MLEDAKGIDSEKSRNIDLLQKLPEESTPHGVPMLSELSLLQLEEGKERIVDLWIRGLV